MSQDRFQPGPPAGLNRAEEARSESEERLRLFIEHAPVALAMFDRDMRYLEVSRRWLTDYGLEDRNVLGRSHYAVFPEIPERWKAVHRRALAGEIVECDEDRLVRAGGSVQHLRWAVRPWHDARGAVGGIVIFTEDITVRKEAEAALKASEERLREADRRKDEFLALLGHELRNPLAPIRNAVELLKIAGPPDPVLNAARETVERHVRHLVRLVDDLLDVNRITRGKLSLRRERIDLVALVEQAAEAFRPQIERAGLKLRLALPAGPVYVDGDAVRLTQVVLNLLDNASKYTEPGGSVRVSAATERDGIALEVADTGIGIAAADLPRLFELFAQVGPPAGQAQGGLGIGLALARALVQLHGGHIEAQSDGLGRGSRFRVRLPAAPTALAQAACGEPPTDPLPELRHGLERVASPARDPGPGATPAPGPGMEGAPDSAATPSTQPETPPAAGRRILVVDDNRDSAESLALLLSLGGFAASVAYDGLEAVEAAERERPSTVLLDLGMPRLDGFGACRQIRAQPWGRRMRVLALTGWGQEEDLRRTREAGFDGHLVKPVEPAALMRLLAEPEPEPG